MFEPRLSTKPLIPPYRSNDLGPSPSICQSKSVSFLSAVGAPKSSGVQQNNPAFYSSLPRQYNTAGLDLTEVIVVSSISVPAGAAEGGDFFTTSTTGAGADSSFGVVPEELGGAPESTPPAEVESFTELILFGTKKI